MPNFFQSKYWIQYLSDEEINLNIMDDSKIGP